MRLIFVVHDFPRASFEKVHLAYSRRCMIFLCKFVDCKLCICTFAVFMREIFSISCSYALPAKNFHYYKQSSSLRKDDASSKTFSAEKMSLGSIPQYFSTENDVVKTSLPQKA